MKIPLCLYLKTYTRNTGDTGKILCPRSRVNNNMHDKDNLNVIFLIPVTSGGEGSCRCVIQTITVQPMCLSDLSQVSVIMVTKPDFSFNI